MSDRAALKAALEVIICNQENKSLNWAVGYAAHAHTMIEMNATDYNLYTQLLYLRGNISNWRGEEAKGVRSVIDSYIKRLAPRRQRQRRR